MARFRSKWSPAAALTGALSVALTVALSVVAIATAGDHERLVIASAIAALVLIVGALVAATNAGVWLAVALLATAGAAADAPGAPLYAIGLFVVAEAGFSSLEERFERRREPGVYRSRLLVLGGVITASLVVGAVMRLLARAEGDSGAQYTVIAAVGILLLVGLVVARARPMGRDTSRSDEIVH